MAFLPEELFTQALVDENAVLHPENIEAYLGRPLGLTTWWDPTTRDLVFRRFRIRSYFFDGERTYPLYRGHRTRRSFTAASPLRAARDAGNYIVRGLNRAGRFRYFQSGASGLGDRHVDGASHGAGVLALLHLWEAVREPNVLQAAEDALDYLLARIEPFGDRPGALVLVFNRRIRLGDVAMTTLALLEHACVTERDTHLAIARGLGGYIEASQVDGGPFIHQRRTYERPEHAYRPDSAGQATLALTRLYRLDQQPHWLEHATRAAHYLIDVRDRPLGADLPHDVWLLTALSELQEIQPDERYLRHGLLLATAILNAQSTNPVYPDDLGGYARHDLNAARQTRALLAAHRLASGAGLVAWSDRLREGIDRGIDYVLQTQIGPERALYMRRPQLALGGFSNGLFDAEIRLDDVAHAIDALLAQHRAPRVR